MLALDWRPKESWRLLVELRREFEALVVAEEVMEEALVARQIGVLQIVSEAYQAPCFLLQVWSNRKQF